MKFRALKADEIDIRIDRVTTKGAMLLLYKNARVDMAILDETVGADNWKRGHEVIHDNLFCNISIWSDERNEWITKQDVGVESFSAKEKGEASDSFKRAGTCWGIGRELYTAPVIFVACKTNKKESGKGYELEKPYELSDLFVSHIEYEESKSDRKIKELVICNKKGDVVFTNIGKPKKPIDPTEPSGEPTNPNARITNAQKTAIEARIKKCNFTVLNVCDKYDIASLDEMTVAQWVNCNDQLAKYEDKLEKKAKESKKGEV